MHTCAEPIASCDTHSHMLLAACESPEAEGKTYMLSMTLTDVTVRSSCDTAAEAEHRPTCLETVLTRRCLTETLLPRLHSSSRHGVLCVLCMLT